MNVYEAVANAVVEQAAEDYRKALCHLLNCVSDIEKLKAM